ncbi:MAG: hypothetical protein HN348_34480, partial [Proteobacteria bacterium]|nr:hypothetical protein [Pseudomonadota bacterium]
MDPNDGAEPTPGRTSALVHQGTFWNETVEYHDARRYGLGGWQLDVLHTYDESTGTLRYGWGGEVHAEPLAPEVFVGGDKWLYDHDGVYRTGLEAPLADDLYLDADGTLYIGMMQEIMRVDPDGTTWSESKWPDINGNVIALTKSPFSGELYYFEQYEDPIIYRLNSYWGAKPVAGKTTDGYSGDGGPATAAELDYVTAMEFAPDGSLWLADSGNLAIRRIGTDGIITTVAGHGGDCVYQSNVQICASGVPVSDSQVGWVFDFDIAPDGTVWILSERLLLRLDPDGMIWHVAGSGARTPPIPNDLMAAPAMELTFENPTTVEIADDGTVYVGLDDGSTIGDLPSLWRLDDDVLTRVEHVKPEGGLNDLVLAPNGDMFIASNWADEVVFAKGKPGIV